MNYQIFQPHPDLEAIVKCYWTLEVPAGYDAPRQRIIPDGCIEMAFILGDELKRYTSGTNQACTQVTKGQYKRKDRRITIVYET